MSQTIGIKKILKSRATIEGAGVHLKRAFGFNEIPTFDPFLLLDDFHSNKPEHYERGFPWHPHRGIETITYVLHGSVEHKDSLGNEGVISSGDVQWMTAGSGIIHQEMPMAGKAGLMWGFQLWANLPKSHKMMDPRYQEVKAEQIPTARLENGTEAKIICGTLNGAKGPVENIVTDPEYLDMTVPSGSVYTHPVRTGHTVFAYVIDGEARFSEEAGSSPSEAESLVLFAEGNQVVVTTNDSPVRFLLVSGKPIGEPIAWAGPIVMNTQGELKTAFEEYHSGTFTKHRS